MKNLFLFFITILLAFGCSDKKQNNTKLTIAAATSLRYVIDPMVAAYEAKYQTECDVILASSGKLTAQIMADAPFDVFISADEGYPQKLVTENLTAGNPRTYAYGSLVLWTNDVDTALDLNILDLNTIQHFAIANPAVAPYGKAAQEALQHYGWYDQLKDKLVLGENISQTNQFILNGNAELGITARATVESIAAKNIGAWIALDPESYQPIRQDIVILKKATERGQSKNAQQFVDFLFLPESQKILKQYGYVLNK